MPNRVDQVISVGMGKAKAVKARVSGLVGVFQVLSEQHGKAGALLKRVKGNADKRAELWPTVRLELLSHERGEMEVLYPELRKYTETLPLADHHDREAAELEQTIRGLDGIAMTSAAWEPKLVELLGLVEHHVGEEENNIFPEAQRVIGADRARALEPMFLAAYDRAKHAA